MEATHGVGTTRLGTPVRIYDTEGGGSHPVVGSWWAAAESRWVPAAWTDSGHVFPGEERSLDIVKLKMD